MESGSLARRLRCNQPMLPTHFTRRPWLRSKWASDGQRQPPELMLRYYEQRAPEYEAVYEKPERQSDLAWLEYQLLEAVTDRRVVEIACGTGYWTRRMAAKATAVLATDASPQLANTAARSAQFDNVAAAVADIYALPDYTEYDCVIGGFIYSHVPAAKRQKFFQSIQRSLGSGKRVVLFDNRFVAGSSTPISNTTPEGDTFQVRRLADGSEHKVLKNFPTAEELSTGLQSICKTVAVQNSEYFWFAVGETGG